MRKVKDSNDNLMQQATFATLCGCHPSNIHKFTKPGGMLHAARVGDRIDLKHKATQDYLAHRLIHHKEKVEEIEYLLDPDEKKNNNPKADQYLGIREQIELQQKNVILQQKEIDLAEKQGKLISKNLVFEGVIGTLNSGFKRFLNDFPKSITNQIIERIKSKTAKEEIQLYVEDQLSTNLETIINETIDNVQKMGLDAVESNKLRHERNWSALINREPQNSNHQVAAS